MLPKQMTIPPHLAELVEWFIATVEPLVDKKGWSVTVNGRPGAVETDVRQTTVEETIHGETRNETRHLRRFRLKKPERA